MKVFDTSPSECWEDIQRLLSRNHSESGILGPSDFGPRLETYDAMHRAGVLKLLVARVDGQAAGYGSFFTMHHPHYPRVRFAQQDAMFFAPEHRGHASGSFLLATEKALIDDGVEAIHRHEPYGKGGILGRAYRRLGYSPVEIGYVKDLREGRAS